MIISCQWGGFGNAFIVLIGHLINGGFVFCVLGAWWVKFFVGEVMVHVINWKGVWGESGGGGGCLHFAYIQFSFGKQVDVVLIFAMASQNKMHCKTSSTACAVMEKNCLCYIGTVELGCPVLWDSLSSLMWDGCSNDLKVLVSSSFNAWSF